MPLFNGENLDGWTQVSKGKFVIENGLLKTDGGMGLLYFNKQAFENVVLLFVGHASNSPQYQLLLPERTVFHTHFESSSSGQRGSVGT